MELHDKALWNEQAFAPLRGDCARCWGLCCTALCFYRDEDFPMDKPVGQPCMHLRQDFRCEVHSRLESLGYKGCMGYDCFGAGQTVAAELYPGENWRTSPQKAPEMYEVFLMVFHLNQMCWLMREVRALLPAQRLWKKADRLLAENRGLCAGPPQELLKNTAAGFDAHRAVADRLLQKAGELTQSRFRKHPRHRTAWLGEKMAGQCMDGADFSMSLLLGSDFSGCSFCGANFLGADTRRTHFDGADLSQAVFLTQEQLDCAFGDRRTLLPPVLRRPDDWH